jgi:hypothetical protein
VNWMPEMIGFLTRYYDIDEASARDVIAEMRDTQSLQSLAGLSRGAGGATLSPPEKFQGLK